MQQSLRCRIADACYYNPEAMLAYYFVEPEYTGSRDRFYRAVEILHEIDRMSAEGIIRSNRGKLYPTNKTKSFLKKETQYDIDQLMDSVGMRS